MRHPVSKLSQESRAPVDPFADIDRIVSGLDFVDPKRSAVVSRLQAAVSNGIPLAYRIAKALLAHRRDSVALFTGFVVPEVYPQGESDGPLGAAALARALRRAGLVPSLFVDPQIVDTARWIAAEIAADVPVHPIDPDTFLGLAETFAIAVAIEKPGCNDRGVLHTFEGRRIENGSAPIDALFLQWAEIGATTVGIGDRGNEIGFGGLHDLVCELTPRARTCACGCGGGIATTTATQFLYPSAVSNWGAYGVAAALAILTADPSLLLLPEEEERLLRVAAVRGCCDGVRRRGVFGVDGLPGRASVDVVAALRSLVLKEVDEVSRE